MNLMAPGMAGTPAAGSQGDVAATPASGSTANGPLWRMILVQRCHNVLVPRAAGRAVLAINVHESAENIGNYIACGDITGTSEAMGTPASGGQQIEVTLRELNNWRRATSAPGRYG